MLRALVETGLLGEEAMEETPMSRAGSKWRDSPAQVGVDGIRWGWQRNESVQGVVQRREGEDMELLRLAAGASASGCGVEGDPPSEQGRLLAPSEPLSRSSHHTSSSRTSHTPN